MQYAGHIGDFVIASEEAIAKGIRRIVALTGPEATKALKKVELLENQLTKIKSIIDNDKTGSKSKENVKSIVELTDDVSHATIPYWKKVNSKTKKISFSLSPITSFYLCFFLFFFYYRMR